MTFIPDRFAQPKNVVDWVHFFSNLTDDKVHWMFKWFPTSEFIIRVMRQAGRKQVIPRVSKMVHYKADFQGDAIPFKYEVGLCILASSAYHTRSRGPPPHPPPNDPKSKGKARMDDTSNIRKDNATHEDNVETSDGRSTPAPNNLPDVELLEDYKPPKFEIFNETGDPKVNLRTYYDKLVGFGKDERIRMKLFMRSLTGDALSWYISQNPKKWLSWVNMASDFMDRFRFNTENALDVFYIQNLKKKPMETFCKYATRWRSEAVKVRPTLEETQMNKFFVQDQDPQYYERLMVIENHKFSDIIKLGERIEEEIKSRMVTNFETLQATNKALQSGGISKKKEVGAVMVARGPKSPFTYQTPPPTYQPSPPRYQQLATTYHTYNTQPAYYHSPLPAHQNYQKARPNFDRRPLGQYTSIVEPIDQLYERLKAAGYVTPIPPVAMENSSQWVIQAKEAAPNVYNNPFPDHRGEGVNVIETDEEWDPEGSIGLIREGDKNTIPPVTLTPIIVQIQLPIKVEVATPTPFKVKTTTPSATPVPFDVEVTTPFTMMVAPTPSFNSNDIRLDYAAEVRRKGKGKMEETSVAQGMTRTGRVYTPEHLGETSKEAAPKQPIIETSPDDLWRKVQAREYSVVDHLNKTPA
ncbi:uncharacterized protein [Nicotiana sylvestris]|uniref:uncharacterized protein n=1 Tax=Nicotiana sylvestris TaxID=4096 RepID=UPI00388C91B6